MAILDPITREMLQISLRQLSILQIVTPPTSLFPSQRTYTLSFAPTAPQKKEIMKASSTFHILNTSPIVFTDALNTPKKSRMSIGSV